MERYADVLDLAQVHMERETALRIASIQLLLREGEGSVHCIDCGDQIPQNRRHQIPNATRCAPCQEEAERGINRGLFRR